jgi:hypothetical protein
MRPKAVGCCFVERFKDRTGKGEQDADGYCGCLAMIISAAMADELEDAHRLALAGRDSYWKCLAREYSRDSNKSMSGQDFASHLASVCASERQNFRVALIDYLSMQSPSADAGAPLTTANDAIALAQKDIVTGFIEHRDAPK